MVLCTGAFFFLFLQIRVLVMRVIATAFCWFQAADRPGRGKKLVSTKGVVIPFFPDAARSFLTERSGLGLACHYDTSEEHTDSHKPDACACHRRLDTFLTNFLERRKERELRKKGGGGGGRRRTTARGGGGECGRRGAGRRRSGGGDEGCASPEKNAPAGCTPNGKEGEEEGGTEQREDRGRTSTSTANEEEEEDEEEKDNDGEEEEDEEGDLAWREVAEDFVFYGISDARFIQAWSKRGEQLIPDQPMPSILGVVRSSRQEETKRRRVAQGREREGDSKSEQEGSNVVGFCSLEDLLPLFRTGNTSRGIPCTFFLERSTVRPSTTSTD